MRAVNLLPREFQGRTTATSWRRFVSPSPVLAGAAGGVAVLATLGALFVTTGGKVDERKREVTELREAQASSAADRTRSADTPARQQREAAVAAAVTQRLAWDVLLTRLAHVVPHGIQLQTLAAAKPGVAAAGETSAPATGAPVSDFTLTGLARTHRDVARLLTRLRLVPGLIDPQLGGSSKSEETGARGKVQFSITAGIDPAQVQA
jgi:Tfp pilus assembly protein PilN